MQGEGLARTGRFYVSFQLPTGSDEEFENFDGLYAGGEEKRGFATEEINNQIQLDNGRRVNAFCRSIAMPDRTMTTTSVITGQGAC